MGTFRSIVKSLTPPIIPQAVRLIVNRAYVSSVGKERNASWYDRTFTKSIAYNSPYYQSHYYFIWCVIVDRLTRQRGREGRSILDIGCGPGQLAEFLRIKGIRSYTGIDLSPVAIEKAKKFCPDFSFIAANALDSSIIDTTYYDTVVCLEFLEHVTEELQVLDRLHSGCEFFGTVPDFPFPSHVRYFSSSEEVRNRYSDFFDSFTVDEYVSTTGKTRFFLMQGIKK